jgi:hypothetical protein
MMSRGLATYRRAQWRGGEAIEVQPPPPPVVAELCPSWPCLTLPTTLSLPSALPLSCVADVGPCPSLSPISGAFK